MTFKSTMYLLLSIILLNSLTMLNAANSLKSKPPKTPTLSDVLYASEIKPVPEVNSLFILNKTIDKEIVASCKENFFLYSKEVEKEKKDYLVAKEQIEHNPLSVADDITIRTIQMITFRYFLEYYEKKYLCSRKTVFNMETGQIINDDYSDQIPTEESEKVTQELKAIIQNTCLAESPVDLSNYSSHRYWKTQYAPKLATTPDLGEQLRCLNENIAAMEYKKQESQSGVITKLALQQKEEEE